MHSGFRGSISGIRVDFGQIVLMERSNALNNTLGEGGGRRGRTQNGSFQSSQPKRFYFGLEVKRCSQNLCSFLFLIKAFNKLKEETRHFILTPAMGCIQPYADTFMALWFAENFQIFQFWSDPKQISFPVFQICSEKLEICRK